jgi:PKD repeat protein
VKLFTRNGKGSRKKISGNSVRSPKTLPLAVEHLEARDLLSTYNLWSPTTVPVNANDPDTGAVEVGVQFKSDVAGTISGIRFYKGTGNTGTHVGQLFTSTGTLLASATFTNETATGWQQVNFSTPVSISANTTYVAAYHANKGHYADDQNYFALSALNNGPLHATNGVYNYGPTGSFPNQTWNFSNYWVDVVFNTTTTTSTPPVANAGPAKTTNEGSAVTLSGSETGGTGPFTYSWNFGDGTTGTGSLTPTHTYANHGTFTATLTVTDSLGQKSSASTAVTVNDVAPTVQVGGPYSGTPGTAISFKGSATDPGATDASGFTWLWDFGDNTTSTVQNPTHTYATAGTYNVKLTVKEASGLSGTATTTANVSTASTSTTYTLFGNTTLQTLSPDPDTNAVELGVKFTSDVAGYATGIRYYQATGNTGTHVGSLWSSTGTLLAQATFTGETGSGWQQVNFSTPVAISPNTTYVASYHTNTGHYVATNNYFATTTLTNGPLHAPAGSNGVYVYSASSAFPSQTYQSTNYYVDLVFNTSPTTPAPVASAGSAQSTNEGGSVTFAGSVTGGSGPFTYSWNFGDGTTGSGSLTPTHTYANHGTFTATLTVTDGFGRSSNNATTVTVADVAPTANAGGPYSGVPGVAISFTGSATDPGTNDAAGFTYAWDFGDNSTSTLKNPTHAYAATGTYTVKLTVTEASGLSSTVSTTASVTTASLPVANAGPAKSTNEGSAVTFSGSETGGVGPFTYSWNFGDGTTGTGSLTPTHTYANHGTFTATLTVTDSLGQKSSASTSVTVNDVAPTANAAGPYSGSPGLAISFNGSATDPGANDASGFTYAWDFGDGTTGTGSSPSHTYAAAGTFTVKLVVKESSGLSSTATTTATIASAPPVGQFVVTPYDNIPNFGYKPTVVSVKSGNWSDPTVWSTGKLPGAGDVVDINAGTTVTYDVNSTVALNTIAINSSGSLKFRTDVNTKVVVGNFEVLPGGYLEIGTAANRIAANVTADIVIANQSINTTQDPNQYGTGLIVLGKMTTFGAAKTPYVLLATEPRAGDTTLKLSAAASGWKVGDKLLLPDTRQLDDMTRGPTNYVPQWEELTIAAIDSTGTVITLGSALKFNHLGAHDSKGTLTFLPHVVNRTRNVIVESQSQTGTRGYAMFTYRADIDVENVDFHNLGRTLDGGTSTDDRYTVEFHDLIGPQTKQANGYQYTYVGNVVDDDDPNNNRLWAIAVDNSHYGLIKNNVVYNAHGAGIAVEGGNETGNVLQGNFIMRVTGTGARLDQGREGNGIWFRGPNNRTIDNIATDINGGGWDQYSYGFAEDSTYLGNINIPAYQGADPGAAGQSITKNGNDMPVLEFARNTVYGATGGGVTFWWIGTFNDTPYADAQQTVLKDINVWNVYARAYFGYPTSNITIDGWVVRGDANKLADGSSWATGLFFADYMQDRLVIQNVDIQGMDTGINAPINMGWTSTVGTTVIQNSYLSNTTNIVVTPPRTVGGTNGLDGKRLNIISVTFGHPPQAPSNWSYNISMDAITSDSLGTSNFSLTDVVYVYNYNGILNNNFQVFYSSKAPSNATTMTGINGKVVAF